MKTKNINSIIVLLIIPLTLMGQINVSSVEIESEELQDFFTFEKIGYKNLNFSGKELKDKTYELSVKEIWDGIVTKDSIILDSKTFFKDQNTPSYLETINDTIFTIRVISKLTDENKLKMQFTFPYFSITREFDAIFSNDYSLRSAMGSELVQLGEKFSFLVYMLPYEKDGMKYYCAVESSGKKIETWGKEFGIKHYLIFEMKFE